MRLYLIRHAHAGQRQSGDHDRYRPLSPQGRARAADLVELFEGAAVDRLLASPATRCLQTLEALSHRRGLEIEEDDLLFEGSDTGLALARMEALETEGALVCSHGDMIPAMLDQLAMAGVPMAGRGCELGSVWVLDRDQAKWVGARYVSPRAAVAGLG